MDPDAILRDLRAEIHEYNQQHNVDHETRGIVDKIVDLDEWISSGGFLPADWT